MERIAVAERGDWKEHVERLGFKFHTIDGARYWTEDAAYLFTAEEIDGLEETTGEIENLCLQAVDRVVKEGAYDRLHIGDEAARLIEASWRRFDKNLYGRLDLAYRTNEPPKLLEYNADTPTALFEASVVQWEWLQTFQPEGDQFNSIHEKLVDAWGKFGLPAPIVHFTCVRGSEEDLGTLDYLRDTATQGKLEARHIYIDEIGWDGRGFRDVDGETISTLFKLYPWEWLMRDDFARNIGPSGVQMIEPPWKMVLSNKAVLALLWEMFEGHPYLLPASFNPRDIDGPLVEKPILSREGANVRLFEKGLGAGSTAAAEGPYGDEPKIYQAYAPVAEYGGNHAVVGSWLIASQPAGIGMREDDGPITRNTSRFVPHFFR